ncbi:MAG: hypothetical protein JXA74_02810, partial [Anaerolineae bacterium]|nr:hypothetical protein [Anaerolineae bacterium]
MNDTYLAQRQLVLLICRVLQEATIPQNIAIEDLRLAMYDADAEEHFSEIIDAWAEMSIGIQRPTDRFTP